MPKTFEGLTCLCFETFYQYFLSSFLKSEQASARIVNNLLDKFKSVNNDSTLDELRKAVTATILSQIDDNLNKFRTYLDYLALKQDTIKFWNDFLFNDCFP